MLIKTLTLHSLTYLVGITSSLAVHQVIPSSGTAAGFQSDTSTKVAIITRQIVNRTVKSDRLPLKQGEPEANGKHLYGCQHTSRQIRNGKPIVSRPLMSLGAALQTLE
jgi:hypothetical protein